MGEESAAMTPRKAGPGSQWLAGQGFDDQLREPDHLGVEVIGGEAPCLPVIAAALRAACWVSARK